MGQKICFSDSYVLCVVRTKNNNNFHFFRQKTRNSLFPQCKTSIDNNSGSIKDRVVKFAYSMGFSEITDRMVWPPSLSRDRNWPHAPIRRRSAWNNTLNACNSRYIHAKTVDNGPENFAVRIKKCNIFNHFFAINSRNYLFMQWKTLIGNNFGLNRGFRAVGCIKWRGAYFSQLFESNEKKN